MFPAIRVRARVWWKTSHSVKNTTFTASQSEKMLAVNQLTLFDVLAFKVTSFTHHDKGNVHQIKHITVFHS